MSPLDSNYTTIDLVLKQQNRMNERAEIISFYNKMVDVIKQDYLIKTTQQIMQNYETTARYMAGLHVMTYLFDGTGWNKPYKPKHEVDLT